MILDRSTILWLEYVWKYEIETRKLLSNVIFLLVDIKSKKLFSNSRSENVDLRKIFMRTTIQKKNFHIRYTL